MGQIKPYSTLFIFKKLHLIYVHMANVNMVNMYQALCQRLLHGLSHAIPMTINNSGSLDRPYFSVAETDSETPRTHSNSHSEWYNQDTSFGWPLSSSLPISRHSRMPYQLLRLSH